MAAAYVLRSDDLLEFLAAYLPLVSHGLLEYHLQPFEIALVETSGWPADAEFRCDRLTTHREADGEFNNNEFAGRGSALVAI